MPYRGSFVRRHGAHWCTHACMHVHQELHVHGSGCPLGAAVQVAYGTTVAIRFVNNVIGGENFIDMARFFGVQ